MCVCVCVCVCLCVYFQSVAPSAGVFYWAGHGCYFHGDSYLIPYDVPVNCGLDDFISVEYIRSKMLSTDPSLCLLLLDMCRQELVLFLATDLRTV